MMMRVYCIKRQPDPFSDVKSLRGIHSARSLAQLAKQTAKEMGKNSAGPLAAIPSGIHTA